MALKRKEHSADYGITDWVFHVRLWKEDSVAGESLVEDTEEVSSTEKKQKCRGRG
ncbi:MAG: hypothetical protein ACLU9V_02395 [Roseburia sp.]